MVDYNPNVRIELTRWGHGKDAIGGDISTPVMVWGATVEMEDRSGSSFEFANAAQTRYDYKIKKRYEKGRATTARDTITHEGKFLVIDSISLDSERFPQFEIIRATKQDVQPD